ncbi:MAG: PIN domain-containing protein [Candidatus Limnocylindrales bacterium]
MIIADTSGLLALFNRTEPEHATVRDLVARQGEPMIVSPYVVAEIDYLVATRVGVRAELEILAELGGGAYVLPEIGAEDLTRIVEVLGKSRDQQIGVADASIVLLAARYGSKSLLTLDHRHFGVLRPLQGGRFKLLP